MLVRSRAKFCVVGLAALCSVAVVAPEAEARATYFTFDVPGAVQYGRGAGVNRNGVIFGSFQDKNGRSHGFIREPDGTITSFDATGATNTYPMAMNDQGVIVGYMHLSGQIAERAFIRSADGSFSGLYPNTELFDVDDREIIVGDSGVGAFILGKDGKLKQITVPDGGYADCRNHSGVVGGNVTSADGDVLQHGFVRAADGTSAVFDGPGAHLTAVVGIDSAGDVGGLYVDSAGGGEHAYLRKADGTFITVDPKGATSAEVNGMDRRGNVFGDVELGTTSQAFIRDAAGHTTVFSVPGASQTSAANGLGRTVVGYYKDVQGEHGYLRIQQ